MTVPYNRSVRKSFYIIDGHAQIFRAFFAPFRDLTSPSGEPTKATFVFTQMLLNLIDQRRPDYLAMVIDEKSGENYRGEIYPEYKANRKAPPDDFHPQEERILKIVADAGVPIFSRPGVEADDVIATMAKKLEEHEFDVFLVSKDKDLRQVLDDHTVMYDVQGDEILDAKKLEEKYGYTPAEAVEIQTLMGDAIDNVPGIPGVGEKTAAKLIKKYGSADEIMRHLDELTPKMRENFEQHGSKMSLSRQLVTLKRDVEVEFDPEACKFVGLKLEGLRPHLVELDFRGLLARVDPSTPVKTAATPAQKKAPSTTKKFEPSLFADADSAGPVEEVVDTAETHKTCSYSLVDTQEKFDQFLADLKKQTRIAIDTETDALGAMQSNLVGLSFAWADRCGFYVPVKGPEGCACLPCNQVLQALRPVLEDPKIKKVGHNLKYDLMVLRQAGIIVQGVELDTMVAAFVLDASQMQYGIDRLALQLLNFRKIATEELIGKGKSQISMDRVALDKIATYASEDADVTLRLFHHFNPQLDASPQLRQLHDEIENPLIEVLVEMETNGIAIDRAVLKEQSIVLGEKIETLRGEIFKAAGGEFNPDSPKQLATVLFDRLGLRVVKKTKTGPSTDIEVLEKLSSEHAVPKLIVDYRSMVKLKNTYIDNLPEYVSPKTDRIHASFSQIGAITGRLSCSDPNLQNIPTRTDEGRRIRSAFVPGDPVNNVLLTADYSQIELRFLAHFTMEPAMVESFEKDEDVHRTVAAEVFNVAPEMVSREQRAQAKIINFGIVYGVTPQGLVRRIDGLTFRGAADLIAAYRKKFPKITQFLDQCVMEAQSKGYVETIRGRRRPILDIASGIVSLRNAAERMSINGVVQGSAADLMKIAMINVYRKLRSENAKSKMLLQVHDELVLETPENVVEQEAELVRSEMVNAMELRVPLKVEFGWGKKWGEIK